MEKSFDFGRLLKNHEKKHKNKPTQFISVAGGVQKRLGDNLKHRKSNRLSVFDRIRNLSRCESPTPVVDTKSKVEHRRQQLEKWKEEKEKRKKQAAAQKKKPFVAGVPHAPLKFVPPPPPPKPMPSTSGRVTRSQSAKQNVTNQKANTKSNRAQLFAPVNASFQPPKNLTKVPALAPVTKNRKDKINYTFDPVLPTQNEKQTKTTRSRTQVNTKQTNTKQTNAKSSIVETRSTRSNARNFTNSSKETKNIQKPSPKAKKMANNIQSSSSTELDSSVSLASSTEKSPVTRVTPRKSIEELRQFTPRNRIPKSESSSEEKLRSPKSPIDVVELPMTPEQVDDESKKISPCVTMSRGKDNARREMKKKMEEGLLDEDTGDIDSIIHFRRQLQSEIDRMTEMCEVWDKIQEQTPLSESIQELVLGAVGQARLLMSQKMQQFASLVERCARPEPGHALVTPADLQGFWDMVFMQVENIDLRFKKLEDLRARGWVEDAPAEIVRKVTKNVAKKPAVAKPSGGPSRLREMIAAARKAKKEQEEATVNTSAPAAPAENSKTFEAGFFCVKSPVRSPALATPNSKHNLLKAVLSSEAKKASASKNTTSFAMLRASIMSKNVEDGIAPLPPSPMTPINFHATPARSILKSANVMSEKKAGKKSIKVVLFDKETENDQSRTDDDKQEDDRDRNSEIDINGVTELHTDSGMSSMDVEKEEKKENKENSRRRGRLVRQDATTTDRNQVMTRSQRRSMNNQLDVSNEEVEEKTPRRSSRKKKALQESENIMEDRMATPKRSVRSRKSGIQNVA